MTTEEEVHQYRREHLQRVTEYLLVSTGPFYAYWDNFENDPALADLMPAFHAALAVAALREET